jgi:aldehyde dehydrogenase (NAD+)
MQAEHVQQLVADPRVKLITFTGSDKVGRILAVEAAKHFKRFVMELGGKNPFIVLKDADLNYAVDCAAFGIYMHQSPSGIAISVNTASSPRRIRSTRNSVPGSSPRRAPSKLAIRAIPRQ